MGALCWVRKVCGWNLSRTGPLACPRSTPKSNNKLGSENKLKAGKLKELSYMIHHTAVQSRLFLKQNEKIKQYDCNFNTRFQLITFLFFGLCSGWSLLWTKWKTKKGKKTGKGDQKEMNTEDWWFHKAENSESKDHKGQGLQKQDRGTITEIGKVRFTRREKLENWSLGGRGKTSLQHPSSSSI